MPIRYINQLGLCFLLCGCATAANVHYASGVTTKFVANPANPNEFRLVSRAGGTSMWSPADLEKGFLAAASHYCAGQSFDHQKSTQTYSYTSSGAFGMVNQHTGYETFGTVACKDAKPQGK